MNKKITAVLKISAVTAALFAVLHLIFALLPYKEFDVFVRRPCSTRVYDCKDNLVQIIPLANGLRREYFEYKEFPSELVKAFVQEEDRRFYFHPGVDLLAVIRAYNQNSKSGQQVSGASTITMQLARIIRSSYTNVENVYQDRRERNIRHKIQETFDALKLEARLSKKQILELYLNTIPFGRNTEGAASASREYFGRELNLLSPQEIRALVKIPRNPRKYSAGIESSGYQYPYYMPHLVHYLSENQFFGYGRKKTRIYKSQVPYCVRLSADIQVQAYVKELCAQAVEKASNSRINNISVLVLDVQTGKVLVWIGSQNWYEDEHNGQIDGVRFKNQPGSSIKPFLYALALDSGTVSPNHVFADVPHSYGGTEVYVPLNFNNRYNGPVRLRVALASSLNVPAVDLIDKTGIRNFAEHLDKLKFNSILRNSTRTGYGLALGGGYVSLQEFVTAFSVFARDGIYKDLDYFCDTDKGKKTDRSRQTRIYSEDTARIIDSILSDKNARMLGFGRYQTFMTEYPSIFKTGTANQYQNITALGATPRYAVGVWMGNFNGETVMGKTGSSLPAWVAKKTLDYLEEYDGLESLEFKEPSGYVKESVCALSGMRPGPGCSATVEEYIKKGTRLDRCSWHVIHNQKVTVEYPAEYQQWLLENNSYSAYSDITVKHEGSKLKITSPNDGALFFSNPFDNVNTKFSVNVIGGSFDELEVYYDGVLYEVLNRPFVFKMELEKGNHEISVKCGSETDCICYEVQ